MTPIFNYFHLPKVLSKHKVSYSYLFMSLKTLENEIQSTHGSPLYNSFCRRIKDCRYTWHFIGSLVYDFIG